MQTVVITGGTGLIGKALTDTLLKAGHTVIVLTRHPEKHTTSEKLRYAAWDPAAGTIDEMAIRSATAVLHLAGAGVADQRWTAKRKQEIRESRVKGGALICKAVAAIPNNIKVVVAASAIGWYGPDPVVPNPAPFQETAPAHDDFLGSTCQAWEESMAPITEMGKRLVILRTGIVLAKEGGALAEFIKPLKLGFATILSSGKQMISWIHLQDLVRLYIYAMETSSWQGVFNAVAPTPVNNRKLVLTLAKELRGNSFLPVHVPGILLKLVMGEMSIEVLKSTTVSSSKLGEANFQFAFPAIEAALTALIKES